MGEGRIAHPKRVGRTTLIASFSGTLAHSPREATMKSVRTAQHVPAWLRATTLAAAVLFKDDVVNLKYNYRGHISVE
jgi:hypothetical protein